MPVAPIFRERLPKLLHKDLSSEGNLGLLSLIEALGHRGILPSSTSHDEIYVLLDDHAPNPKWLHVPAEGSTVGDVDSGCVGESSSHEAGQELRLAAAGLTLQDHDPALALVDELDLLLKQLAPNDAQSILDVELLHLLYEGEFVGLAIYLLPDAGDSHGAARDRGASEVNADAAFSLVSSHQVAPPEHHVDVVLRQVSVEEASYERR
mmetsp:Transcript_16841/g.33611  ORF Transcript_16841/g.33611 Transcript_16841/m.33611 type:complete len:208 (+) Transcript_16841:373-996(+)